MDNIKDLCAQWIAVKEQEKETVIWRRDLEDQIVQRLRLQDAETNTTKEIGGFKISTTIRVEKKVDVDAIREIAAQHELQGSLRNLFRWDAKVNTRAWSKEDPEITDLLKHGIINKMGRPSFKIEEM